MPSNFALQRTDIVGPANENGRVRMLLADGLDQDQSKEWSLLQVEADTRDMNQLAAIQLRALQRLQTLIGPKIYDLESRLAVDRLQP